MADDIKGMVRRNDGKTARAAAKVIVRKRSELHTRVIDAFQTHGSMTDEELESLPEFEGYGPSTLRKRRSELFQDGVVREVGESVNSRGSVMKIWNLLVQSTVTASAA